MINAETAMTNKLGEYRIFGVRAGRYKLRAMLYGNTLGNREREEHAPTYYAG